MKNYTNLNDYPNLLKEWSEKNIDNKEKLILSKDYIWNCPKGHDYTLKLIYRTKRDLKCPYCAGQRVLEGFNDAATTDPWIIERFSKNSVYKPNEITRGSKKKVLLICDNKHEYEQIAKNAIILKRGCPYCSGHKKEKGINDLLTIFPKIAEEYSFRNETPIEEIWAFTNPKYKKEVEWICKKNPKHIWKYSLNRRIELKKNNACPYCDEKLPEEGINDLATIYPILKKEWSPDNENNLSSYTRQSCFKAKWICEKNHTWHSYIFHRTEGNGRCPICFSKGSKSEDEIYDFIISKLGEEKIIKNDRKILNGLELDIYIPDKNIAFEFNGVYWHSEKFSKDKNYHYDKWKMCHDKGIQLITIWEDEWINKKEIIKTMILNKLNLSKQDKCPARKTRFKIIDSKTAKIFCEKNHIQGKVDGKYSYALTFNDEIVAVMILSKGLKENSLIIHRFCTSKIVQGGFSKLINKIIKIHESLEEITTFSDNSKSNGSLYENNNFIIDKQLNPDYSYVKNSSRIHKFNYRKKKFKNDPNLIYKDNISEYELAKLNNLYRIWDCGKIKWIRKINLSKNRGELQ